MIFGFDSSILLIFVVFWTLTVVNWRKSMKQQSMQDWILDITGLLIQGFIVPILQIVIVSNGLKHLFPELAGKLSLSPVLQFLIGFVLVDYLYYWNHRLLHHSRFWFLHRVHHSSVNLSHLSTSRNSLWTPAFIIYLWAFGALVFLFENSTGFQWAMACTAALDLWRHSPYQPNQSISRWLMKLFILPQDHHWHHSSHIAGKNFGANLNCWDRLHGTYLETTEFPVQTGEQLIGIKNSLFAPWKLEP